MPIEFRCNHCDKLLRVPDESAGQDAQCPSCGAVVQVPASGASPSVPFGGVPGGAPFGGPPAPDSSQPVNPYQAPAYSTAPPTFQSSGGFRSGPPWERDGASIRSFIETVKLGFSFSLFPDMRREGGLGPPIWFGVAGGMVGTLAAMIYSLAFQGLQFAALGNFGGGGGGNNLDPAAIGGIMGFILVFAICGLVITPVMLVLGMFIGAGITHLMLMLLKGDHFPFETTFRVVAYSSGISYLLLIVPMCGQYVQGIFHIVVLIFGLISAQEISGGKATAAVLLPAVICCAVAIGVAFAVVAMIAAAGAAGQGGGF